MGININGSKRSDNGFFGDFSESKPSYQNNSSINSDFSINSSTDAIGMLVDKFMNDLGKLLLTDLNPIFDDLITTIEKKINRKLTFDEYVQVIGSMIDERIIKTQTEQGIKFISGKLHFKVNNEKKLLDFKVDCYYQNAIKQWIKQESVGHTTLSKFDDSAHPQLNEIYASGILTIDIDPPETSF